MEICRCVSSFVKLSIWNYDFHVTLYFDLGERSAATVRRMTFLWMVCTHDQFVISMPSCDSCEHSISCICLSSSLRSVIFYSWFLCRPRKSRKSLPLTSSFSSSCCLKLKMRPVKPFRPRYVAKLMLTKCGVVAWCATVLLTYTCPFLACTLE